VWDSGGLCSLGWCYLLDVRDARVADAGGIAYSVRVLQIELNTRFLSCLRNRVTSRHSQVVLNKPCSVG